MYDINPLGPMLHLKELERQAVPKLRPLRPTRRGASFVGLSAAIVALLRRLRAVGIPLHTARHS